MTTYPFDPDWVVHPGATLADWMKEAGLPKRVAYVLSGLTSEELDGVLDGTVAITEQIADKLARLTFISAKFWLGYEHNFRVGLAAGKHWDPS